MEINNKITGSTLSADEFNQIPDELEGLILSSGQTPSSSDTTQIKKSIFQLISDGNFYETGGTDNNILLTPVTPRIAPFNLTNGTQVRFTAKYNNTGNTKINLNDLGEKKLTINGLDIPANTLLAGEIYTATYLTNIDSFELFNTGFLNANINLSNLSSTGENRLHALKGYEDTGELLTDAEGLADVKSYAHSTFDSSKFTVTGTPIVTNNGIASGFSNSDYLQAGYSAVTTDNVTIVGKFNTGALTNAIEAFLNTGVDISATNNGVLFEVANTSSGGGKPRVLFATGIDSTGSTQGMYLNNALSANTDYTFKIEYKNSSISAYVYDMAGNVVSSNVGYTTNVPATLKILPCIIGKATTSGRYFTGSADLKYFKVIVNGVEIFSGNKTGIDTIKPDNYTVVGTPTITADGIASGFSSSNYINASDVLSTTKVQKYIFEGEINTFALTSSSQFIFSIKCGSGNLSIFGLAIRANNKFGVLTTDGSTSTIYDSSITAEDNTNYSYKLETDLNTYAKLYINGNLEINQTLSYSNVKSIDGILRIGNYAYDTSASFSNGSIDLNAFKIYADGDLVYQPCLKIPYTLSKTGSKIADSIYRSRVSDMYSQYGYAPYYTLSGTDFTLPEGEIYGMIGKASDGSQCMPSDTYTDLTLGASDSTYTAPANGWFLLDKIGSDQEYIYIGVPGYSGFTLSASGTQGLCATVPVKKGDVIRVEYNASGILNDFRFIYAVGAESEAQ